MTDRDDVKQPMDHLPPAGEREDDVPDQPSYPGPGAPPPTSAVSPETAAEPTEPGRHGLAKPPTTGM